jgi:glycolate oxidase FAD binding subunit
MRDRILAARVEGTPLRLRGGGTKDFYGETLRGAVLDTREHCGIVSYEPSELVVHARCGTSLSEIESALGERGQFLAFEPPRFGGEPTIGGVVAGGLSGPRRATAGAARDFVLGANLMNCQGEVLKFGGQVMKNVAGFDVSRLLCGSLGILGLITEVSIKVLPVPHTECTLCFDLDLATTIDRFNRWSRQPLPISASAWHRDRAYLRLSGAPSAVRAARVVVGGDLLERASAAAWWKGVRDQTLDLFAPREPLWRVSLPSNAIFDLPQVVCVEWAGALRWLASDLPAGRVRAAATAVGGTATLWRGARDGTKFHPLDATNLALHRRLKTQFDPRGIFNPGRLLEDI